MEDHRTNYRNNEEYSCNGSYINIFQMIRLLTVGKSIKTSGIFQHDISNSQQQ